MLRIGSVTAPGSGAGTPALSAAAQQHRILLYRGASRRGLQNAPLAASAPDLGDHRVVEQVEEPVCGDAGPALGAL